MSKITNVPVSSLVPLGSTGKSDRSGDVDLAIDTNVYPIDLVIQNLKQNVTHSFRNYNPGTDVWSFVIEIPSRSTNDCVQVDLMFTDNIDWVKFSYFSDPEHSDFKGAVRTALLMAVTTTISVDGTDLCKYDSTGLLIIRASRTFDLKRGIRRIFHYRPKKVRGGGYRSSMSRVTRDEMNQLITPEKINQTDVVIDDPITATGLLFGDGVQPNDVQTAEQVIALIYRQYGDTATEIFDRAYYRIKHIAGKIDLPVELIR